MGVIRGGQVIEGAIQRGDIVPYFGIEYYVDSVNGSASGDGRSWQSAFNSITLAMAAAAALLTRGGVRIYVAPGGYTENIITPLNTELPFGMLIAMNPTKESRGAAWLIGETVTEPTITVRARGWLIDGFEVDAPSTDGCIFLDTVTANAQAKFLELANLLIVGNTYANGFGVDTNEPNPLTVIRDSYFMGFMGTSGRAITSTNVYALEWLLERCIFWNNKNHVAPKNSKGWQASVIRECVFHKYESVSETVIKIDMRGGAGNVVTKNFLGGTYDNAGGYYSSSTDEWRGNETEDSHQAARPVA